MLQVLRRQLQQQLQASCTGVTDDDSGSRSQWDSQRQKQQLAQTRAGCACAPRAPNPAVADTAAVTIVYTPAVTGGTCRADLNTCGCACAPRAPDRRQLQRSYSGSYSGSYIIKHAGSYSGTYSGWYSGSAQRRRLTSSRFMRVASSCREFIRSVCCRMLRRWRQSRQRRRRRQRQQRRRRRRRWRRGGTRTAERVSTCTYSSGCCSARTGCR
jgi:hypothetical protein